MRTNKNDIEYHDDGEETRAEFRARAMKPSRTRSKWNYHSNKKRPTAINGIQRRRNKRSF